MAATKRRQRVLVGSTTGRGPCEECGVVAELHLAEERVPGKPVRVLAVCLPHGHGADPAPQLARAA